MKEIKPGHARSTCLKCYLNVTQYCCGLLYSGYEVCMRNKLYINLEPICESNSV
jgi:hypothetical protein